MARKKKLIEHKSNGEIVKSMKMAWSSLISHLDDTVTQDGMTKKEIALIGDRSFHVQCVKEYAEIIYTLSKQLKK